MTNFCPSHLWDEDNDYICAICLRDDNSCDCPECSECGEIGDVACFSEHKQEPAQDSIAAFIDSRGIAENLRETFRAIDRHGDGYAVILKLHDGTVLASNESDRSKCDNIKPCTRIARIGVSAIAWDGTDWEFFEDEKICLENCDFNQTLQDLVHNRDDALAEHNSLKED